MQGRHPKQKGRLRVGVIATDPKRSLNKTFSCDARRKLGSLDVEVMSGVSAFG